MAFFKRLRLRARDGLTSEEARHRLSTIERALELQLHDKHQAEVNRQEGETVASLVQSLSDIPSACIRVGSLVVVKFEKDGKSEFHARELSPKEMTAVMQYPELHKKPEKFFESLHDIVNLPAIDPCSEDMGNE